MCVCPLGQRGHLPSQFPGNFHSEPCRSISQNYIHCKVERKLNSGTVFYSAVPNLLFFSLLSKNVKIKIAILNHNVTCCFVWARDCLSVKGRTHIENV
jgi:hypothetical protein